ncbi:MAG: HypC/HybG/HupF family hydrogenase formation chaperone [Bacillota bacterium]|jgi:hydrogenase expression/formation protein HypC
MCLAIPGRIIEIGEGHMALVESGRVRQKVSVMLLPNVKEGDYVLVHAGFAIQCIDEKSALETQKLFEEMFMDESG